VREGEGQWAEAGVVEGGGAMLVGAEVEERGGGVGTGWA
jgi:hypothetical protein